MKVYLKLIDYPNISDLADAIKDLVDAGFEPVIEPVYSYPYVFPYVYPNYPYQVYPKYPTWTDSGITVYKGEAYLTNREA